MNLSVLTPEKQVFEGEVVSVKVPGSMGAFQVLENHAALVSSLKEGEVAVKVAGSGYQLFDEESGELQAVDTAKDINFSIQGGFIEVINNKISLLVSNVGEIK